MLCIKGCIAKIIEKNYEGKLRSVVIVKIGAYINKNINNELAIFFNENKRHLLNDFSENDYVLIDCNTLSFTNDNHRFYNYIMGHSVRFDVSNYPYYRRKSIGKKFEKMITQVEFPTDFDYEKMILDGWTNAGLIEAGYVTKKITPKN